jgi:hypothetical protein
MKLIRPGKAIGSLICLTVLIILSALYDYSFTDFTMTRTGYDKQPADLPFLKVSDRPNGVYKLEGNVALSALSPKTYNIIVDDRLLDLKINGVDVDLSKIPDEHLYDWQHGFDIDLSTYLTEKINSVQFHFQDYTGLYGVRMLSDFSEPRLIPFRIIWILCLGILLWNALIFLGIRKDLAVLVILGIGARIAYTIITDFNVRGHDTDEHIEYIMYFVNNWSLPNLGAANGGAYFHPPLYYFISSIFYKVANFFHPNQPRYAYGVLQYLSVAYSAGFLIYSALLTQKVFGVLFKNAEGHLIIGAIHFKLASALALTLLVFWPAAIMHSPRIGNDPLLYFFFSAGLYYIFCYFITPSSKLFMLGAIFSALTIATKANGAILVALGGIVLLTLWRTRKPLIDARLIKKGVFPTLIMVAALALTFYPGIALKMKGDRTHLYIDNITNIPSTLKTGNNAGNYLWMDLKVFITQPYTSPYTDEFGRQYFANYLSKTGLVGEWWFDGNLAQDSVGVISFSYLFLLLFFVIGLYHFFRGDFTKTSPLLWAYFLLFASIYYMRMTFPANIDFRYILPVLLPFVLLYNIGMIRMYQGGKERLALTGYGIEVVFITGSLAFLLHFFITP